MDGQRKKVSNATEQEVSAVAERVRADLVARNRIAGDSRRTVTQLLDYWGTEIAPQRVWGSTVDTSQRMIRLYLKPLLGDIRLKATVKLAFATMSRSAERWCRVSVNDLERPPSCACSEPNSASTRRLR